MIVLLPAVLAATYAAVLSVAAFSGGWIVAAAAGFCVLALAVGWAPLLNLPSPIGTALLIGGLGASAVVAGTLAASPGSGVTRPLAVFTAVIAFGVLTSFLHELLRRDGRPDVVESVTGTLAGQMIAVLAAGWVLLWYTSAGSSGIVTAASAVVASRFVADLPVPVAAQIRAWVGVAVGTIVAVVVSYLVPDVRTPTAVALGLAVSGVGVAIDLLFKPLREERFDLSILARAAAPVAVAGSVAYAVVRIGVS